MSDDQTIENSQGSTPNAEPKSIEDLPEWASKYIGELRKQAAGYRDAKSSLSSEKKQLEESVRQAQDKACSLEEKLQELTQEKIALSKRSAVISAGLPEGFTKFLSGDSLDGWESQIGELLQLKDKTSSLTIDPAQVSESKVDKQQGWARVIFG